MSSYWMDVPDRHAGTAADVVAALPSHDDALEAAVAHARTADAYLRHSDVGEVTPVAATHAATARAWAAIADQIAIRSERHHDRCH